MERFCKICKCVLRHRGATCRTCISKIRRYLTKKRAVEYLGGKCNRCGYDKHLAALEFHHSEPSTKDLTIGQMLNKKWESLVEELDKCELLCSNCHRIEHTKYDDTSSLVLEAGGSAKPSE